MSSAAATEVQAGNHDLGEDREEKMNPCLRVMLGFCACCGFIGASAAIGGQMAQDDIDSRRERYYEQRSHI